MAYLLKTSETRVWRTYRGGASLDRWQGRVQKHFIAHGARLVRADGMFPEDWAASTTRAVNPGREDIVEGLSRVVAGLPGLDPGQEGPLLADVIAQDPAGFLGEAHVRRFGAQAGFLVKLIDAGERLTIQVHPDRQYAREVLNSSYGKAESWYILDNAGGKACLYLGFKPGITRERWKSLFEAQDIEGMLACLHRITVRPGDSWFVAGGVPHAIGEGCFLAEVQEPTDYTMRVELVTPGGLHIDERQCHQGVGYERMLDCFHYEGHTLEETEALWKAWPRRELESEKGASYVDALIDGRLTELFSLRAVEVRDTLTLPSSGQMGLFITISGAGEMFCGAEHLPIRQGEVVVTGAGAPGLQVRGDLRLLWCQGPRV